MARNEEKLIDGCIQSLKPFVDEIIVVDNGSTDHTKKIALKNGCRVFESPDSDVDKRRMLYVENAKMEWLFRQGCFCNENGRLEETAQILRNLYLSVDKDMRRFVEVINESGAGWYFEDNFLYTKYLSCPCPMLQNAELSQSLTWCQCTAGYTKMRLYA